MTDASAFPEAAPIWARARAFPLAPKDASGNIGWGWVDAQDRSFPCDSLPSLAKAIREDRDSKICLVWTPQRERMTVPEEVPELLTAVGEAKSRWAADDLANAQQKILLLGSALVAATGYVFWKIRAFPTLKNFFKVGEIPLGLALLAFIIFAFIPWYQARKRRAELTGWNAGKMAESLPLIRFEIWLARQKSPLTRVFLALMALTGLAQMLCKKSSIEAAGLVAAKYHSGETWRLLTAPFLHGNTVHFLMNAAGLLYLGKRLEVFARWPHLPLVFLFSAWVGGLASLRFNDTTSVGASGGLMGWLGFLLVFETLHRGLVPRTATRRLLAGLVLTGLIGLIGYRYVDNAAHGGGLVAGMLYAFIVFPKSTSVIRPKVLMPDRLVGAAAVLLATASACFAMGKMF